MEKFYSNYDFVIDLLRLRKETYKIFTSLQNEQLSKIFDLTKQCCNDLSRLGEQASETSTPQQQFDKELLRFLQVQLIKIVVQIGEVLAFVSFKADHVVRILSKNSKTSSSEQHSNCDSSNIPPSSTSGASIEPNKKRKRTSFDKSTERKSTSTKKSKGRR